MRAPLAAFAMGTALTREWLLRNDHGDLASGTVSGVQVRLRHLALATPNEHGRPIAQLLRLDARVGSGHQVYDLTWRPADPRTPAAPRAVIESFRREPWPTWIYRAGDTLIEKQLLLVHDRTAIVNVWRHLEGPALRLAVTPVIAVDGGGAPLPAEPPAAAGDMDPLAAAATAIDRVAVQAIPGRVRLGLAGMHRLTVWHDGAFLPVRSWRSAREGAADAEAGQAPDERGDVVGFVEAMLGADAALHLVIATDEALLRRLAENGRLGTPPPRSLAGCVEAIARDERRHIDDASRESIAAATVTAGDAWTARHPGETVPTIAFGLSDLWIPRLAGGLDDWARREDSNLPAPYLAAGGSEALCAVRGLVALRRFEPAREILLTLGQLLREGLVPSSFESTGAPRYESADPSLWLVIASELFARRTGEYEFVRHALFPLLEQVVDRFRTGTVLGGRLREDGLLAAADGAARADLNALWYTAQAAMGQLARALGQKQSGAFYIAWAREHHARFNELLWDDTLGAPFIAVLPTGPVRGLEPSLLLAASLSPPLLPADRALSLVGAIERELWMPAGLREAPGAPRILPRWMGHYLTAFVRAEGRSDGAQEHARRIVARFGAALDEHGAGHLPEAFELGADAAFDGAPLQSAGEPIALSGTAEMLRFWIEELDHVESAAPAAY